MCGGSESFVVGNDEEGFTFDIFSVGGDLVLRLPLSAVLPYFRPASKRDNYLDSEIFADLTHRPH